jgi:DNA-binding NtrC family response regulator
MTVNCGAVPRELMEAEFFGSEKGSFTGSNARKLGRIEVASGGTLFLDELAELPAELQPKLLRVLQERTFMRIGGTKEIQADIRVICATNRDLEGLVREGLFREDLYYRLNVFPIRIPPLRERRQDIVPLARRFLSEAAEAAGRGHLTFSAGAEALLTAAAWPGNVRQLQNAIERAVILAEGRELSVEDLQPVPGEGVAEEEGELPPGVTLIEVGRHAQRRAESQAIRRALQETDGNKTEAARRLGVSYKTLWSKLKEYEIG